MSAIFSKILNMSLTGSLVILFVLAARLLLKRAPKIYSYALWAVVLFRLLCPVSLSAPVSVLEVTQPQVTVTEGITSSVSYLPVTYVTSEKAPAEETPEVPEVSQTQKTSKWTMTNIASVIWLAGCAVMLLYSCAVYLRLRWQLVGAFLYRGEVYLADHISSPFAMGIVRPKIYLPSNTPRQERRYIIAHERHHIHRLDHVWKLLAYAALCIHWFNPLVWLSFLLAGKDMEMSCDEAVIRKLGPQIRADYSQSLLRLATHRTVIAGTPLAFGEGETKDRIVNMAKWRRPKVWVSILCGVMCIAVLAACALNPVSSTESDIQYAYGAFTLTLPEDYGWQENEDLSVSILEGEEVIGGIALRKTPSFPLDRGGVEGETYIENNFSEWVEALGLPEAQSNLMLTGWIGDTLWGDLEAEYYDEANPDAFYRMHYFYIHDYGVYDIWFDYTKLEPREEVPILETVQLAAPAAETEPASEPQRAALAFKLPDGITESRDEEGNQIFLKDGVVIGGVLDYIVPANTYWADFSEEFLREMGVPEVLDGTLGYSGGGNAMSQYGYTMEFFSDVPPGAVRSHHSEHTYFMLSDGQIVTDIWFDLLTVDPEDQRQIMDSLEIPELGRVAENDPAVYVEKGEQVAADADLFQNSYTNHDGTVNFSVSALLPNAPTDVSILEAQPHYLTNEEIKQAAYAIFGADAYFIEKAPDFADYNRTDKQMQDFIDRNSPYTDPAKWQELVGSGGINAMNCEELAQNTQQLIDMYQEKLNNYRCDYPEQPCEWILKNHGYYTDGYYVEDMWDSIEAWVEVDGFSYAFTASTRNAGNYKLNNLYVNPFWPTGYSDLDERLLYSQHCRVEPTAQQVDQAKQKAETMLANMGFGEWIVDQLFVEVIEYHNPEYPEYVIHVNALPKVAHLLEVRWAQRSNINQASEYPTCADNYYLTQAEFEFTPDGHLLSATIMSPMDTAEVSKTNTHMGTETLLARIEEELKTTTLADYGLDPVSYGYENLKCDVTVNDIHYGMARVRIPDTEASYEYIPAITVRGNSTYIFANGDRMETPTVDDQGQNLLTLSALDGHVISKVSEFYY